MLFINEFYRKIIRGLDTFVSFLVFFCFYELPQLMWPFNFLYTKYFWNGVYYKKNKEFAPKVGNLIHFINTPFQMRGKNSFVRVSEL